MARIAARLRAMRSATCGCSTAESVEFRDRQFQARDIGIGPDVGRPRLVEQRHFAEFHALVEAREPHAARQLHADHAALQEEQRRRRLVGGDDALPGGDNCAPCRARSDRQSLVGETGEQRLFFQVRAVFGGEIAAVAEDDLILRPFDGLIEQRKRAHAGDLGNERADDGRDLRSSARCRRGSPSPPAVTLRRISASNSPPALGDRGDAAEIDDQERRSAFRQAAATRSRWWRR